MTLPRYSYIEGDSSRFLAVELLEPSSNSMTKIGVECVLDVDDFDEVAGIEVLDVSSQLQIPGSACVEPIDSPGVRLTYDETVDALYLKLGRARAQHQILTGATFSLDSKHVLVRVEVSVPRGHPQEA
jgi:uncharacterized protein YuzE